MERRKRNDEPVIALVYLGHQVYQVPDAEKAEVPEEVLKAAREMAERAFQDRLREIKMTSFDQEQYEEFSEPIRYVLFLSVISLVNWPPT